MEEQLNSLKQSAKKNLRIFYIVLFLFIVGVMTSLYQNKSDEDEIVGEWNIKYFSLTGNQSFDAGKVIFDDSGILIIKPSSYYVQTGTVNWKSYSGNLIDIGTKRYKYILKNNNLQLVRNQGIKSGYEYGYISLTKDKPEKK